MFDLRWSVILQLTPHLGVNYEQQRKIEQQLPHHICGTSPGCFVPGYHSPGQGYRGSYGLAFWLCRYRINGAQRRTDGSRFRETGLFT